MNTYIDRQDQSKVAEMIEKLGERGWEAGARNWLKEAGGDERYALWLYLCDRRMSRALGVGIFDIEDWTWADAYEGGYSPSEACQEALENSDTYSLFMGGE